MTSLFVDMDDVVADFTKKAIELVGYIAKDGQKKYPIKDWQLFLNNPRLYRDLDKCIDADCIVHTCKHIANTKNWNVIFLTAVPRDNDFPWAFTDKIEWARIHFPEIPVWFGPFSKDKHTHCTPGDILIDDRINNINEWIKSGGIGILHTTSAETIQQLTLL
jgi:5'(3')-deoxyribonucleotidase